jgi:hypothetical protein
MRQLDQNHRSLKRSSSGSRADAETWLWLSPILRRGMGESEISWGILAVWFTMLIQKWDESFPNAGR